MHLLSLVLVVADQKEYSFPVKISEGPQIS